MAGQEGKSLSPSVKQKRTQKGKTTPEKCEPGPTTAHDWRNEKAIKLDAKIDPVAVEFFDDGTVTFFWVSIRAFYE